MEYHLRVRSYQGGLSAAFMQGSGDWEAASSRTPHSRPEGDSQSSLRWYTRSKADRLRRPPHSAGSTCSPVSLQKRSVGMRTGEPSASVENRWPGHGFPVGQADGPQLSIKTALRQFPSTRVRNRARVQGRFDMSSPLLLLRPLFERFFPIRVVIFL